MNRCAWAGNDPLYIDYHDREWGVPIRDENRLFEFLILEGAQAGLSWITILRKRERYRAAFANFDPYRIAAFDETDEARLLSDPGIVRNRLKIRAAIANARAFVRLKEGGASFAELVWQFVDGEPVTNHWSSQSEVPAETPVSAAMTKELKRLGFRFVGSTICYSFMQAAGLVNDHVMSCFRHGEICEIVSRNVAPSAGLPRLSGE